MEIAAYLLDISIVIAAFVSAWFWLQAGGRPMRRVSKYEEFNHADLNRLVTALNRARLHNARAAIATAVAALLAGLRVTLDLLP